MISSRVISFSQIKSFLKPITAKEQQHRSRLEKISQIKKNKIESFIRFAKLFPNLKMIAITGSVAVNNAPQNADIDLMLIFSANTLWLTRPIFLFLCRLLFPLRHPQDSPSPDSFCLNLWLDTFALSIPRHKRSLYTAHEVLQVVPILDREYTYQHFILSNSWTKNFLANAYVQITSSFKSQPKIYSSGKNVFNLFFFFIQYLYMRSKITREYITPHAAYFHPRDFSQRLKKYLGPNQPKKKTDLSQTLV